mmetsp:Transcript_24315/g.36477  ORF Transcript_24315/g.36477 Transcript_24315/m.36477 type:complete len:141 (+) Transcript_24315:33-455(+)
MRRSISRFASITRRSMSSYAPKTVQEAWDNHFQAFGGQDVQKILLDYNDKSKVTYYNATEKTKAIFEGEKQIGEMFTGLFKDLSDLNTLEAPEIDVCEDSKTVFLVWACPGCGYEKITDTFVFDDEFKISRQFIFGVMKE